MKTLICCISIAALIMMSACSKDSSKTGEASDEKTCLIGEWKYVENGVTKSFSFREDKSGKEVMSATDVRPYTWSADENKVSIVYDSDPSKKAWDFTLNCEANQLTVFGLPFKK
jgi:hypothetical protein